VLNVRLNEIRLKSTGFLRNYNTDNSAMRLLTFDSVLGVGGAESFRLWFPFSLISSVTLLLQSVEEIIFNMSCFVM